MSTADASAARQDSAVTDLADTNLGATVAGPPGADGFAALELSLGLVPGTHRLIVNGQDLSRSVSRASVHVDAGPGAATFPVVVLELRAGAAEISGPGIVQVLADDAGQAQTLAAAVAEFIEGVDPNAVDQAVLNAGMGVSPGEAALQVIAALARRG